MVLPYVVIISPLTYESKLFPFYITKGWRLNIFWKLNIFGYLISFGDLITKYLLHFLNFWSRFKRKTWGKFRGTSVLVLFTFSRNWKRGRLKMWIAQSSEIKEPSNKFYSGNFWQKGKNFNILGQHRPIAKCSRFRVLWKSKQI